MIKENYMETEFNKRNSTPVLAWVGFVFSLLYFLMICMAYAFIFKNRHNEVGSMVGSPTVGIITLVLLCGVFGILGLVFSLIGFNAARRIDAKKWPGAWGIALSCLSVLSFMVPVIISPFIHREPMTVIVPSQIEDDIDGANDSGVVLVRVTSRNIKLYDNRNGVDKTPATIRVYTYDIAHQIKTWMQLNGVSTTSTFVLSTDENTDYSDVVEVVDALKELGITKYRLQSLN